MHPLAFALALSLPLSDEAESVVVVAHPSAARVTLDDGRTVRLFGVEDGPRTAAPLASGAWRMTRWAEWRGPLRPEAEAVWLVRPTTCLNIRLVQEGVAWPRREPDTGPPAAALMDVAARAAARARRGLWSEMTTGPPAPTRWRAVTLPLHSIDAEYSYHREVTEIAELGANVLSITFAATQTHAGSSHVQPHRAAASPHETRIRQTIRTAHDAGLAVLLMPLVLLSQPRADEWRGRIRPRHAKRWWASYRDELLRWARIAQEEGIAALCVGSELCAMEQDDAAWRETIRQVRGRFAGDVTYSANWDHFASVPFWDALDFPSMTAYFRLTRDEPTPEALLAGWARGREEVLHLAQLTGQAVFLSEVGVPSRVGGATEPWNHSRRETVDLATQDAAFRAFERVFGNDLREGAHLRGVSLYDWWGWGGATCPAYTARDKPALATWRRLLKSR